MRHLKHRIHLDFTLKGHRQATDLKGWHWRTSAQLNKHETGRVQTTRMCRKQPQPWSRLSPDQAAFAGQSSLRH